MFIVYGCFWTVALAWDRWIGWGHWRSEYNLNTLLHFKEWLFVVPNLKSGLSHRLHARISHQTAIEFQATVIRSSS